MIHIDRQEYLKIQIMNNNSNKLTVYQWHFLKLNKFTEFYSSFPISHSKFKLHY